MRKNLSTAGRIFALIVTTALAFGLIAAPASAQTPHTRYVAPSGSGGGSCAHPDFHRIQRAVDASGPGDTILVCAGTYRGGFRIAGAAHDGLTVKSVVPWAAVVLATGIDDLVVIRGADGVTVQWLALVVRTDCRGCGGETGTMVAVRGASKDVVIRANRITFEGPGSGLGEYFGYGAGITVSKRSTAWIGYNDVRDFQHVGIWDVGVGTVIVRNSVVYRHKGSLEWGECGMFSTGIFGGDSSRIVGNHLLGVGIVGTIVRDNLVRFGTVVVHDGSVVAGNTIIGSCGPGIEVWSRTTGFVVRKNTVHGARNDKIWEVDGNGIRVWRGSAGIVRDNDFSGNHAVDCVDTSTGDGTAGTANTWVRNLGDESTPDGICSAPAP